MDNLLPIILYHKKSPLANGDFEQNIFDVYRKADLYPTSAPHLCIASPIGVSWQKR